MIRALSRCALFVACAAGAAPAVHAQARPSEVDGARVTEATLDQEWISLDEDVELAQLERAKPLRAIDQRALHVNDRWQQGTDAPAPSEGDDGRVVLVYGTTRPKLVCAPLRVCMIQLQAGETVTDLQSGDSARWKVELSISGASTYVVVKPRSPGLETDLAIITDRRVYTFTLASHASDHMAIIAFDYPEDQRVAWRRQIAAQARQQKAEPSVTAPKPADDVITVDPKKLNTRYDVKIDHPWFCRRRRNCVDWAPREIVDDGKRTWIQMPASITGRALPVLFERTRAGREKVQYRWKPESMTFYVDRVMNKAELLLGINGNEGVVTLIRQGER